MRRAALTQDGSAVLLTAACVVAPAAVGCTGEWSRLALEGVVVAAAILLCAGPGSAPAWGMLMPPFIAGLCALQLVPLPDRLLTSLAPVSGGAWKVTHAGQPGVWGTISIDPGATASAIRRLMLCLATVVIVKELAVDARRHRLLLAGLSAAAVVVLSLGLAFPVNPERRVLLGIVPIYGPIEFWRDPIVPPIQTSGWAYLEWITVGKNRYLLDVGAPGDGFGSYISTNQFPAGVYLTLPVALGMLLYVVRSRLPKAVAYALVLAVMAGATWVIAKMAGSRAGTLSIVMTCLIWLWLTVQPRWLRRSLGLASATFALAVFGLTLVLFGHIKAVDSLVPDAWQATVETIRKDGRVLAADVALRMFRASPVLGTGLGTYGDLYTRFIGKDSMCHYAHNDYLQCLAEAGIVGLALMGAGCAALVVAFRRYRRDASWPESLVGAGPWAALAGIAVHSAFDWNLHVPANAFLACVVTGLCLASERQPTAAAGGSANAGSRWRFLPPCALALSCVVCLLLLARDAWSDAVQRRLRTALVEEIWASDDTLPPTKPTLKQSLEAGRVAARWDPANSNLALLNGRLCLHLAESSGPKSRVALSAESERWFLEAQRTCAIRRGLPEPVPKQPPQPQ